MPATSTSELTPLAVSLATSATARHSYMLAFVPMQLVHSHRRSERKSLWGRRCSSSTTMRRTGELREAKVGRNRISTECRTGSVMQRLPSRLGRRLSGRRTLANRSLCRSARLAAAGTPGCMRLPRRVPGLVRPGRRFFSLSHPAAAGRERNQKSRLLVECAAAPRWGNGDQFRLSHPPPRPLHVPCKRRRPRHRNLSLL